MTGTARSRLRLAVEQRRFDVPDCTHRGDGRCRDDACRFSLRPHWAKRGGLPEWAPACALEVAELSAANGGLTLDAVGGLLGVTRERVRQIEERALSRLQRTMRRQSVSSSRAARARERENSQV